MQSYENPFDCEAKTFSPELPSLQLVIAAEGDLNCASFFFWVRGATITGCVRFYETPEAQLFKPYSPDIKKRSDLDLDATVNAYCQHFIFEKFLGRRKREYKLSGLIVSKRTVLFVSCTYWVLGGGKTEIVENLLDSRLSNHENCDI